MKRIVLIFTTGLILLGLAGFARAQCPEDTVDSGICDTLYVEGYPPDLQVGPQGPHRVRFPIYVTHDVPYPNIDSIASFVIPLCYTHTNPSKYCSVNDLWNNTFLYPFPSLNHSIFRHLDGETNWMMALSERLDGSEWDTRILNLDGTSYFRLSIVASGSQDQRFEEGSRVLLATMTFKLEDTMTVCIDTCFWPSTDGLVFVRSDAVTYVPRHFLPVCEAVSQYSMVINEVMFYPDTTDTAHYRNHEWVELFNYGDTANIGGCVISNRDAPQYAALPDWEFPESTYLVIHFTTGENDSDFSDGEGDYYAGSGDVFSDSMDECALYTGTPSVSTIFDFLSWAADTFFTGGLAHDYAVDAGIWDSEDYFALFDTGSIDLTDPVEPGESIGRDSSSTDTDQPEDWNTEGGADAIDITPGAQNYHDLTIHSGPGPNPGPLPPKAWTIMVYMDADKNLGRYWLRDIARKMEAVGSDDNINIVVQYFTSGTAAYRFYVTHHPGSGLASYRDQVFPPGVGNPGDPAQLEDFVTWAMTDYPADHYVLFIAGHGDGWKGTLFDRSQDRLTMPDLKAALDPLTETIDVVVFYSCLMGMIEVARQISDYADFMVASQEITLTVFPFHKVLSALKNNLATWGGQDFAEYSVEQFDSALSRCNNKRWRDRRTTSTIHVSGLEFDLLLGWVDVLGDSLRSGVDNFKSYYDPNDNVQMRIKDNLSKTERFSDKNFIDLYHFAELIFDDEDIPLQYREDAWWIMLRLGPGGGVVLQHKNGPKHPNAHGLSIYFPKYQTKYFEDKYDNPFDNPFQGRRYIPSVVNKYAFDPDDCMPPFQPCVDHSDQAKNHPIPPTPDFLFVEETQWDEFLHRYYEPVADAGKDTVVFVGSSVILNGSGSSDADGTIKHWYWDINSLVDHGPPCPPDIEDWDRDCVDEKNDDRDTTGQTVQYTFTSPGMYTVTLSVWDDHNEQNGHEQHFETDQDSVIIICLPQLVDFPETIGDQSHNMNGTYSTDGFTVVAHDGTIISVTASFTGSGVASVMVVYDPGYSPPKDTVKGHVEYTVTDHCLAGGVVTITATDDRGGVGTDDFDIMLINDAPVVTCPADTSVKYCDGYAGVATATDANGDAVTFTGDHTAGDGTIDWDTDCNDVGVHTLTVTATDVCGATDQCQFTVTVTNATPTITCPGDAIVTAGAPFVSTDFSATDDCNDFTVAVLSVTPAPAGAMPTIVGSHVEWTTDVDDEGLYTICLQVTDGCGLTAECSFQLRVVPSGFSIVLIAEIDCVNPGDFVCLPVLLNNNTTPFGGFELEVEFDYTSMTFVGAEPGELIEGFEKFTYRLLPCPACGCCKYKILLYGQYDMPNGVENIGDPIPMTPSGEYQELMELCFVVNSNENLRGLKIPVCWEWEGTVVNDTLVEDWECSENTFSSWSGDTLYTSSLLCQFKADICDSSTDRIQPILIFQDGVCGQNCGGIDVCPGDDPGHCKRGDVNFNTMTYEVADAVLFASYFVEGTSVFRYDQAYQICATDVNADGRTLTLSDLVYLIRVILHDAVAIPKLTPSDEVANVIVSGGIISTECAAPIGAILFEFDGAVSPTLLADMEMVSKDNKVLVWSSKGKSFSTAEVLSFEGDAELVTATAVDRDSRELSTTITAKVAPTAFALHAAYPNPFNPFTNLSFNLPEAMNYSLKIYNVAGQLVRSYDGVGSQNLNVVTWDGKDNAGSQVSSGVYFYKLTAAGFSATEKMVMMK